MFCVNVKSKEFKEACNRLNIHPSSLEVIVFQYLNNIDSGSFPSDEYIMSKLEGKAMTNASESQILLWEKAYSTPKVFSDKDSVGAFIKEASKYFSPDSISIYRNNEGQYVARVTKPENREAYEKELKRILDNAPRNEQGQLLAPNGKPTKLSERQYAQVRTKAFKKWFGDWTKITKNEDGTWNIPADVSKIIDEETGEPKVVYHGSPNTTFTVFDKEKIGSNTDGGFYGRGFYFSEDKGISNKYGKEREFFLNIKNPYEINPDKIGWEESDRRADIVHNFNAKEPTPYDSELSQYDGVLQTLIENGEVLYMAEIVVPDANQIKSATDNVGTFSTESDDIRFSFIGVSGAKNIDIQEETVSRIHGLYIAREMVKKGKSISEIKIATGWEIGADGRWRYEIDEGIDESMVETLVQNSNSIIEKRKTRIEELEREGNSDLAYLYSTLSAEEFFLEEIVGYDNPLFIAYPNMRHTRVTHKYRESELINGEYDPKFDSIKIIIDKDTNFYREARTLVHEIQHAIQEREGFAKGGSIEGIPKNKELEAQLRELGVLELKLQTESGSINAIIREGNKPYLPPTMRSFLIKGLQNKEVVGLIPEKGDINIGEILNTVHSEIKEVNRKQYEYQYNQYLKLAGEVEAREAAFHVGIPKEYRKYYTLGDSISLEDQIVIGALLNGGNNINGTLFNLKVAYNSINSVLDYLSSSLRDNGRTSLIHKFKDGYYITKTAFDGGNTQSVMDTYETAKELIINHLIAEGLPAEAVSFIEGKNSIKIIPNPEVISDTIERNEESVKLGKLFESSKEAQKVLDVLNFLSNKTGLKYKVVSEKEAAKIIGSGTGIRKTNAFVKGDTCYFIEGRQLNVDIAAEEMLHPFVASIRQLNPAAFKSLLRDAQRAFPRLRLEIIRNYKGRPIEEIQEELVTQALSRAFREDIKNTPEGHSVKELIKNFINRIVEIFQSFFGENNSEVITEYKTRVDEILEREEINAQDLQSTITINELAKIVNSGLKLYSPNIEGTRMNASWARTSENSYEVSTAGDRRFSAMVARFNPGTIIEGIDVGGMTIEQVYQSVIKKSRKGQPPAEDSMINRPVIESQLSEEARRDFYSKNKEDWSYRIGYLPLWQEWAKQNPQLIEELRENSAGKTLTDKFANTRVSQARALAEILNSTRKEESTTTESSSELETRTQNEEFMENNLALITELENLYDLGLTDTDIHTIGTQLMQWISEHLTVLHNTPGELQRVYNIEGKDASTMSRKDIAELVTPKRLMEQCIREFRRPKAGMGWEDVDLLNDIADNARLLLFLSSNTFTALEGFSIIMPGADFGVMANIDVTTNEFNDANDDIQIQEEEGSSIEHWIRANTTITLDERISLDVKTAIYKCYRIGKDGKPVVSKWGIKERIPYEEARNIIVNVCSGCLTLNMMVDALEKAKEDYPWLGQLIVQIKPSNNAAENGARTQLQSAFFRDMYMARNAYSVVKKNGDKFESVIVNENTALKEITSSIITEFTIGSHPLFGDKLGTDSYKELVSLYEEIKDISDITTENRDKVINALLGIYNNLGFYNITQDLVESILTKDNVNNIASSLNDLLIKLEKGYRIQEETGNKYYPFEYSIGKSAPNSILGNLRAILRIPASKIDNTTAFSVYDNGKMHQSFCTPSYLFKLMTKLGLKDDAKFREFMSNEFDQYQWFAIEQDGKTVYRLSWLQEMQNQETREILKHKIQLNFNKHNYMRNMNSSEYALSVLAEFFCEKSKLKGREVAWYRVPMLSNKPSSEFIRFVRYTGPTYKDVITDALYEVYSQEMSRIQTVRLRNQHPESVEYISNFDKRGLEFCFLTFLNEHLGTSSELGLLMEQRLNGNTDVINLEEEKIKEAIKEWMDQRSTEIINNWENSGILEKASEIANIGDNKIEVKRNIENFIWNDVLASINIQELTITDPALYKDVEDIQKRIAQMHSPGIRPNVDAVDFEGNKVSDGYHRAMTFADFEDVISNVIDNITVICDRRIENAKAKLKKGEETSVEVEEAKAFKELLVGENGLYRQINATDAQAYSCATSYRKKAFMFGKWSKSAEAVYHKLKKGEYVSMSDIQTAFQPLKPFVYSQISKSSGVKDAPMPKLRVGIQNKNSEYLLVMAEALIQNENTGKPNLLRAINEFMEETADRFPTRGIDTIEYGSAVKVGKQTRLIDISKATSVEDAKEIMRAHVFKGYKKGTWDTYQVEDPNNPYTEKVDTIPAEDYSIQQEVPAHFRDHQQAEGSQSRAITPSDLPSVDANGNPVTFATGYNIDGTPTGHMSSKEFVREWEETHADNIDESIDLLVQELKLDSLSKKDRNITIARLLQKEILANPNRYGTDLLIACSLDANYEFRIPLGDPIQSKRVEQLLNSIVKNRINKQTIAGGPIVQVSNFGTSKQLSIKFNGKDGKVLDSYEEWSSKEENKEKSLEDYKKYIKENQAGIAYMECLAPAYTKELFANFMDENGNVDIEAVEATSPELLKMVGYRIPTEDKYSISPLKIVGFLPRVAGDGIMLPYDITLINGSDFDIKFIGVIKLC